MLVGTICFLLVNISADQAITCEAGEIVWGQRVCTFHDVTFKPNASVTIATNPEDFDARTIEWVWFSSSSSVHAIPRDVLTKFPNLKTFSALDQNIREIEPNTFDDANNLEEIELDRNELSFLSKVSFSCFFYDHWNFRTFKDNLKLTHIYLHGNKLSALHPQMFAHLRDLQALYLFGNLCIDKYFDPVTSLASIENELSPLSGICKRPTR